MRQVIKYRGFWYLARTRSRKIKVNLQNPAKFTKTCKIPRNSPEILSNTCRYNIFETYFGFWGCLIAVNLQLYLETSPTQRANSVPKLPGRNYVAKNWALVMTSLKIPCNLIFFFTTYQKPCIITRFIRYIAERSRYKLALFMQLRTFFMMKAKQHMMKCLF